MDTKNSEFGGLKYDGTLKAQDGRLIAFDVSVVCTAAKSYMKDSTESVLRERNKNKMTMYDPFTKFSLVDEFIGNIYSHYGARLEKTRKVMDNFMLPTDEKISKIEKCEKGEKYKNRLWRILSSNIGKNGSILFMKAHSAMETYSEVTCNENCISLMKTKNYIRRLQ